MIAILAVNWVTVFAAAIASFVVGMIWYSPAMFGKQWMKMMGITPKEMKSGQKEMGPTMVKGFLLGLIQVFVLAQVFGWIVVSNLVDAVIIAGWVWVGFMATIAMMGVIYERKSMDWFFISAGYQLASILVAAIVLTVL